jgi:uncharacterized protein (DUF1800 family)
MTASLNQIDPQWAFSPYVPSAKEPFTLAKAAHLFRRAGFGATHAQLEEAVGMSPADLVHRLIASSAEPAEYRREIDELARAYLGGGDPRKLSAWWVYRMLTTPDQLREKCTLFWHGHFATSAAKVAEPQLMYNQNELLRRHALEGFPALVQEISRDPAMLIYLDSATNRKAHPNENYAREVMELFCLGEGQYSEQDIRELARCFTGWEIRRERFRFNANQHDSGVKTILGQTGEFGGEEGVNVVLQQPAAPRFIVRKLIRYFLFDEPAPSDALVEDLAGPFGASGMQMAPLLERMLSSNLFFSNHCLGRKVRSPVEMGVGFLRALSGSTNVLKLTEELGELGQAVFFPPNVKGWDGGRAWINSSTLLGRANLVRWLLDSSTTRFAGGTLGALFEAQGLRSASGIVDDLVARLFAVPVPAAAREQAVALISHAGAERERALRDALYLLCTLPEFQLC